MSDAHFGMKTLEESGLTEEDWDFADDFATKRSDHWESVNPKMLDWPFFDAQLTDAVLIGIEWERNRQKGRRL